MKLAITHQPQAQYAVQPDLLDKIVLLPPNREVLCPNCSHRRTTTEKQKRPCFRKFINGDSIGFSCENCGLRGAIFQEDGYRPKHYTPAEVKVDLPDSIIQYFAGRKIFVNTLRRYKVGYRTSDKNGMSYVALPYFDENGNQVGIKYRDQSPEGYGDKRYWKEKNSKSYLYGLHALPPEASSASQELVITEGEIDTLAGAESGLYVILSLPDGISKDTQQGKKLDAPLKYSADLLSRFDFFVLALDGDDASKAAIKELAERLGKHRCKVVKYPEGTKDLNQVLIKYGPEKVKQVVSEAELWPMEGVAEFKDEKDLMMELLDKGFPTIPSLGLTAGFDDMIRFIHGQINLITGIPNHGKTAFTLQLMLHLSITRGWKWGIFTPEQENPAKIGHRRLPKKAFLTQSLVEPLVGCSMYRNLGMVVGGQYQSIPQMSKDVFSVAYDFIDEHFKIIEAGETNTLVKILEKVDYLKIKYGISGFLIDPWNKVSGVLERDNNKLSNILNKLGYFVRGRELCCFIVAHPNKIDQSKVKIQTINGQEYTIYPVPNGYSVKGGGEMKDLIDNIFTVYRLMGESAMEFYSWKVKHKMLGMPGKKVLFRYNQVNGRFEDPDQPMNFEPWIDLELYATPMPF